MLATRIVRVVAAVAAFAVGFAWAAPATAIGIAAGVVAALTVVGFAGWLLRLMLQPGAGEGEREQRLVPRLVSTVWVVALAAACVYVAYDTHTGVYAGAHGLDFVPSALPFALLALSATRQLRLSALDSGPAGLLPDLDLS